MRNRLVVLKERTLSMEREMRELADSVTCGPESKIIRARLRETANALRISADCFREAIDGYVYSLEEL